MGHLRDVLRQIRGLHGERRPPLRRHSRLPVARIPPVLFLCEHAWPIRSADDLAGARIGIPEWGQTASIYTRGYIAHELGVPLTEIEWVQAGVNQAGRVEKTSSSFRKVSVIAASLRAPSTEMLRRGASTSR